MNHLNAQYGNRTQRFASDHPRKYTHKDEIAKITSHYNLTLRTIHNQIKIEGSPERTSYRTVFEDINGSLFIIEKLASRTVPLKRSIANALEFLQKKGLSYVQPYLKNTNNEYILSRNHQYWQIVPYIDGTDLPRPEYVYEQWRGKLFAAFLIKLKKTSRSIPHFKRNNAFDIKAYIDQLLVAIKKHKPSLLKKFQPILNFLEKDYLNHYDNLPKSFCHGDFHPLNIIWHPQKIQSVIDWEFCGYNNEIYDVANMIGCIGIEDPNSLTGPLVVEMIKTLKGANIYSQRSWKYLLESIIAQRFAWLSEWLRKHDLEMQEMEEEYLKLLIKKQHTLKDCWEILTPTPQACIYV